VYIYCPSNTAALFDYLPLQVCHLNI